MKLSDIKCRKHKQTQLHTANTSDEGKDNGRRRPEIRPRRGPATPQRGH